MSLFFFKKIFKIAQIQIELKLAKIIPNEHILKSPNFITAGTIIN